MDVFKPLLKTVWFFTEKADEKRIASQTAPQGIICKENIAYIDDYNKYHLLDFYYPENTSENLPLIIDIHGGGWWYGTKEINKYYCMELAKRGFIVANINYRLADRVDISGQLSDIFSCLNWIDKNSGKYYIDRNNVFLTGDSAGGQFCCLTAQINADEKLRKKLLLPANNLKFNAAAATSPVIDLVSPNIMMNVNLNALLATSHHKSSPYYFLMKFKNIASEKLPPFFVVTSSGDFVRKQGRELHKILDELNVENEFYDYTEKYDGRKLPHVFSVTMPFCPASQKCIDDMTEFFKRHINK